MNEAGAPAQLPDTKLPNNIAIMAGHADLTGGVRADEETMKAILATLTRADALFHCARVNTIATGFDARVSSIERQRRLVAMYCNQDQIAAINAFAKAHGGVSRIAVLFQGQMLELARDEDDLMSGRSVYVTHHFSIAVRAPGESHGRREMKPPPLGRAVKALHQKSVVQARKAAHQCFGHA